MEIKICTGKTCTSKFSHYIRQRLERDQEIYNKNIDFSPGLCMDHCKKGPCIKIDDKIYTNMSPAKASEIIFKK